MKSFLRLPKAVVLKLRPAGRIRPAKLVNPARETLLFISLFDHLYVTI